MYDDIPELVDSAPAPWGGTSRSQEPWGEAGDNGDRVIPGGFGAGLPQPSFAPTATPLMYPITPSQGFRNFANAGHTPFAFPPAAFDQAFHLPHAHSQPEFQAMQAPNSPWISPAMRTRPLNGPWKTPQGTPRRAQPAQLGSADADSELGLEGWPNVRDLRPDLVHWGKSPLKRTHSIGGSSASANQDSTNGFVSGPRYKYQRPGDWRPEFTMPKPGVLRRLLSIGRGSSDGGLNFPNFLGGKPSLHWTIDAKVSACSWDIRQPLSSFKILPEQRPLSFLELQETAISPSPHRICLVHPFLPWYIIVEAGPGEVITVAHLLQSLQTELARPIFHSDFWNDDVDEENRKVIHAAWEERCRGNVVIAQEGIKRIDFLGDRCIFEGLKRDGNEWELKMKSWRT